MNDLKQGKSETGTSIAIYKGSETHTPGLYTSLLQEV